ncbi:hypothetical protein IC582_028174 [Cucumis melo]
MQSHPTTNGLLNKPFPYCNELAYVFGRNRANGRFAETFVDVGSNEPIGYDGFDMPNGNEQFSSVYNQGIDMSQEDVRASRPFLASEGRTELSELKRKRGNQQEGELEVIHVALECTNDHLRTIAEWPARILVNDNHVCQEFLHLLREMLELTSLNRALL